jgi:probable O-glycosylation ligase (exosortase A-associated)
MAKIILMSAVISAYLTDLKRLRLFLLVVAVSLGFYGFKGGIFSLGTQGQFMVWGPGNSIIGANNNLGLALNMVLPVFWYLAKAETNAWAKRVLQICFLLTIPAIMFTYSRGSFIGLAVVIAFMIWKGKHRILSVGLVLVLSLLILAFLPQRWVDRTNSTLTYEQDSSATSRLDNWRFCWKLALDRPWTGGGFQFFTLETVNRYDPDFVRKYGKTWDTHNIYLGVLAGHGFPAFVVFMIMIIFTFDSCRRLKKKARENPQVAWIALYSDLVQVALAGWAVNGLFVNMEYFELPYHLVAITAALKVILRRELIDALPDAGGRGDGRQLNAAA